MLYLCTAFERKRYNAEIAQLVEHNLAKVGVASSSLVFRSLIEQNDSTKSPGGGMVDAPVSGTGVSNDVQVRVLFWALQNGLGCTRENLIASTSVSIGLSHYYKKRMERWRNW